MKFIPILLASVLSFIPGVAKSMSLDDNHNNLIRSLQNSGITVVINPLECLDDGIDGGYLSSHNLVFICQDNMQKAYSPVGWTDNDLDTLRHEAHHVIQDCNGTPLGDNSLEPIFTESQIVEFAQELFPEERVDQLIEYYWNGDIPEEQAKNLLYNELEAFVVAESVSAGSIAEKVELVCSS